MLLKPFSMLKAASAGTFTPLSLEGAGRTVVWYDMQDAATVWQDDAGTSALTADAQTYGRIDDLASGSRNLVQTDGTARPAQITHGGIKHLRFDGTNDNLRTATGTVTARTVAYLVAAVRTQSGAGADWFYFSLDSNAVNYVGIGARPSDNKAYVNLRGGSPNISVSAPSSAVDITSSSETRVQTGKLDVNSLITRVQGTQVASSTPTIADTWRGTSWFVTLGYPGGFQGATVDVAQAVAVVCDGAANDLSAGELADLEEFVRVKGGCPAF